MFSTPALMENKLFVLCVEIKHIIVHIMMVTCLKAKLPELTNYHDTSWLEGDDHE